VKEIPTIKIIDYGIAYCVTNGNEKYIEVNKNLFQYPKLFKRVMKHEMKHYNYKGKFDFWTDFLESFCFIHQYNLFKFQWKHPEAKESNRVFFKEDNGTYVNYYLLTIRLIMAVISIILLLILVYKILR